MTLNLDTANMVAHYYILHVYYTKLLSLSHRHLEYVYNILSNASLCYIGQSASLDVHDKYRRNYNKFHMLHVNSSESGALV